MNGKNFKSKHQMKRAHEFVDVERRVKVQRTVEESTKIEESQPIFNTRQEPQPIFNTRQEPQPIFITRQEFSQQSTQYQEIIISLHARIVALEQERRPMNTRHCGMEYQQ